MLEGFFYIDGLTRNRSGFSVGDQTAVGVWTPQRSISSTGNIATNGTITSTGIISSGSTTTSGYIAATGSLTAIPTTPTAMGCYLGCENGQFAALERCAIYSAYIDFTTANTDWKGRMLYTLYTVAFEWFIGSKSTAK